MICGVIQVRYPQGGIQTDVLSVNLIKTFTSVFTLWAELQKVYLIDSNDIYI